MYLSIWFAMWLGPYCGVCLDIPCSHKCFTQGIQSMLDVYIINPTIMSICLIIITLIISSTQ